MRKEMDLPEYRFDQELVMALLDPQTFSIMPLDTPVLGEGTTKCGPRKKR